MCSVNRKDVFICLNFLWHLVFEGFCQGSSTALWGYLCREWRHKENTEEKDMVELNMLWESFASAHIPIRIFEKLNLIFTRCWKTLSMNCIFLFTCLSLTMRSKFLNKGLKFIPGCPQYYYHSLHPNIKVF